MPLPRNTSQNEEARSEEVSEIISHVPNWIIRWGITLLFVIFLSILVICWFIRYPDTISASVIITTEPTPATLVSRREGRLNLLKGQGELVNPGELVGYIETPAKVEDVNWLEGQLLAADNRDFTPNNRILGDIQPYFSSFANAKSNLDQFTKSRSYEQQIGQLRQQEVLYARGVSLAKEQLTLSQQELLLSNDQYRTDSVLHTQKVISDLDFNRSRSSWLQKQRLSKNDEGALLADQLQLNNTRKQILDLELQQAEQLTRLETSLQNSRAELLASIQSWKESSLLIAPSTGKISFLEFFEDQSYVPAGKPILTIVPLQGNLIAKAEMPIAGSGKVKPGQRVNIRLANYPFEQFGMLHGELKNISLMPNNETYLAEIELPHGLTTNTGNNLEFRHNLSGSTEIITEDLRLLERVFYQFRRLIYR